MSKVSVQLENELTLAAARENVWNLMTEVPLVVPCIPGGRLLETVSDSSWKAEVALDLGFTRAVFLADVLRRDLDPERSTAVLEVRAIDSTGRSSAQATMTSRLSPTDCGTQVAVLTDLTIEGDVARFGAGIIEDVSYEIVEQMTRCLEKRLARPDGDEQPPPAARRLSLWSVIAFWIRGRVKRWTAKLR